MAKLQRDLSEFIELLSSTGVDFVVVGGHAVAFHGHPRLAAALMEAPLHEAPLNHEVALASRTIKLEHEDPADRFLAATATIYDLALATADARLLAGKGFRTLANR